MTAPASPVRRKPGARSLWAVFAAPLAIAVASVVGLVAALTGDGLPDVLSWVTLAVPVAATGWALYARRR